MQREHSEQYRAMATLEEAASLGDAAAVSLLVSRRADPNASGPDGTTPLLAAALEGHADVVRVLLAAGADPQAADHEGWTALHNVMMSCGPSAIDCLRLLIAAAADVNQRRSDGLTPLHLVHVADPKLDWKRYAGMEAMGRTAYYSPAVVQTIVGAHGDVNARTPTGSTPLHESAAEGAFSCVMGLLNAGANPQLADAEGRSPLQVLGSRYTAGGNVRETKELLERIGEMLSASALASEVEQAGSSGSGDGDQGDDASESAAWAHALEVLQKKMGRLHARRQEDECPTASTSILALALPSHGGFIGKRSLLTGDGHDGAEIRAVSASRQRRKSSRRLDGPEHGADTGLAQGASGLTVYAADALSFG